MRVNALDHINISTTDIAASARFYAELLDLDPRNGPAPLPPEQVMWLYDHSGHPIIHLVKRDIAPGATGPIDHVALNCSGKDELLGRLRKLGIEPAIHEVAALKRTLIFARDPHGVMLELNFND